MRSHWNTGCLQTVRGGVREWSKWVRFPGRLLGDQWFWKKKKKRQRGRGKSRHPTETISFCLGAWKAAGGSKKAKDKLWGYRRCLLELGFAEGHKRSTWGLLEGDHWFPLLSFLLGQLRSMEPAFRYLQQMTGPRPAGSGLGDGGGRVCADVGGRLRRPFSSLKDSHLLL